VGSPGGWSQVSASTFATVAAGRGGLPGGRVLSRSRPTVEGTGAIVLDINALVRAGLIAAGQRQEGALSIGDVLR